MGPDSKAEERSNTERVIEAVADHRGVDPMELEPLYNAVDPDALDALFGGSRASPHSSLTFELDGCLVRVSGDGDVEVSSTGDERRTER